MRVPRVRFTVRRVMAAAAVVALLMSLAVWRSRVSPSAEELKYRAGSYRSAERQYRQWARSRRMEASRRLIEAGRHRREAETTRRWAETAEAAPYGLSEADKEQAVVADLDLAVSEESTAAELLEEAKGYDRHATECGRKARRYDIAALFRWLPIAPDRDHEEISADIPMVPPTGEPAEFR